MFGYLNISKRSPEKVKQYFKYSYCSLCKALDEHYGPFGRCLISYDVTVFALFVVDPELHKDYKKIHCIRGKTYTQKSEIFRSLASLNILLFREKLIDCINDSGKFRYKFLYFIYKRLFKKTQKNDPALSKLIHLKFAEFYKNETEELNIMEISNRFSDVITEIGFFYKLNKEKNDILGEIAKWVYFIDAVDDLEKDIKNSEFNALKKMINNNEDDFKVFIDLYKLLYKPDFEKLDLKKIDELTIFHLVKHSIPDTTFKIMRRKLYV